MHRSAHVTLAIVLAAGFIGLGGCSSDSSPAAKKEEEKKTPAAPVAPVSGQSAAFQMYQMARQWGGPDMQLLMVEDFPIDEVQPADGKYGAWRAKFLAPSRNKARNFTYAVVDAQGGLIKGARAGEEEVYSKSPLVKPFTISDLKIDTTKALEVAKEQKEAQEYIKKNPTMPVHYMLEWTLQTAVPAWRVIWGASVGQSAFSIYVDAGSGKYLKTAH